MPIEQNQLPARKMPTPCSSHQTCLPDLSPVEFHTHALKRADSHLSASCCVRLHALTVSTFRRPTHSRSEVEPKRANQSCQRHASLLCHAHRHSDTTTMPETICHICLTNQERTSQTKGEQNISIYFPRLIANPFGKDER